MTHKNLHEDWLAQRRAENQLLDLELLTKACECVLEINEEKLEEGLNIADELRVLHCDSQTLAAAILYPMIYYDHPSAEKIEKYVSADIYKLAQDVRKMDAVQSVSQSSQNHASADNLRKMCLAMVDDVRIVLVKLAEQLVLLKRLRHASPESQKKAAQQVSAIYAPLANRLGVGHIKWQMEDFTFRYLNPEEYRKMSKALNMRRQDREIFIHKMIERLHGLLESSGVQGAEITGRAKHIYSIYKKLQRKQVQFEQIYDTSALRILVKTIEECYKSLSMVHSSFPHIQSEFDDYIAKPKSNGYRSIHTVIVSPENINVEIQIRTYQMHEESELGVAAHWQYKEGGSGKTSNYADKISWLRHIMDWQKEVSEPQENLYHKIFEDRVYVFTPNGDVFDLEAGATPLDFAYHVHTDLGHRCRGAKVNNAMVPLTYPLRTGDQVAIIAGKEKQPSRDWLNPTAHYLKTSAAQQKIRSWFKKQEQQHHVAAGLALWEKMGRREGLSKSDLEKAIPYFKFKNLQEMLIAIGSGTLGVTSVINRIKNPQNDEAKKAVIIPEKAAEKLSIQKSEGLQIEGVSHLLTTLARCCKPIPGDSIIGFITRGRGVTIHQQDCRNIQLMMKRHAEKLCEVNWGSQPNQSYVVEFAMEAEDRAGLLRDISNVITAEHLSLLGLNTRIDKLENRAHLNFSIEINNLIPLKKLLSEFSKISGVLTVRRI